MHRPDLYDDMRLLVCEDDMFLAAAMTEQFAELGVTVVAVAGSLAEIRALFERGVDANAAVLDVKLADGEVYPAVRQLEDQAMALVFYTAYLAQECPAEFAHIPWLDKLTPATEVLDLLRAMRHARRHSNNN